MRILFFDDDPQRHKEFRRLCRAAGLDAAVLDDIYHTHRIEQAKVALNGDRFDWAFLDHDLDGQVGVEPGERTGLAVAQYIAGMVPGQRPGRVVIHTMSPEGEAAMLAALYSARFRRVQAAYFGGPEFLALVEEMARGL